MLLIHAIEQLAKKCDTWKCIPQCDDNILNAIY